MRTLPAAILLSLAVFTPSVAVAAREPDVTIPAPATGIQTGAGFGSSVLRTADYIIVGAPNEDDHGEDRGVVRVFDAATGNLLHRIRSPKTDNAPQFGSVLALSGNILAVGAPHYGGSIPVGNAFEFVRSAGAVYLFDLSSGTPLMPVAIIPNPEPGTDDVFGTSIAIAGTRLVVGSPLDGENVEGSAFVFNLTTPASPVLVTKLANPDPTADEDFGQGAYFGGDVAIAGNRVIVGAPGEMEGGVHSGAVYVFDFSSTPPALPSLTLHHPSGTPATSFGAALAADGDRLAVGSQDADNVFIYDLASATPSTVERTIPLPGGGPAHGGFGRTLALLGAKLAVGFSQPGGEVTSLDQYGYMFDLGGVTPETPTLVLEPPASASALVGVVSLAIRGDSVLVGAPSVPHPTELDFEGSPLGPIGAVFTYDLLGSAPETPTGTVRAVPSVYASSFGNAAAISGSRAAISSPDDGKVYLHDLNGNTPTNPSLTLQMDTIAGFGSSVAMDGDLLLVGAPLSNDPVFGGVARLFDTSSATAATPILELSMTPAGESEDFGTSVAVAGNLIAVSAPGNNVGASNSGAVHIFDRSSGTPQVPTAIITNPTPAADERFGTVLAVSGTRLIVGVSRDGNTMSNAGVAYVYDLSGLTPTVPVWTLNVQKPTLNMRFGASVAISGDWVAISAPGAVSANTSKGSVYVYHLSGAVPGAAIQPKVLLNDQRANVLVDFGNRILLSGPLLLVSAGVNPGYTFERRVYLYDLSLADPSGPVSTLLEPGPPNKDDFGGRVAFDGTNALVVDTKHADGTAYVYKPLVKAISVIQRTALTSGESVVDFGGVAVLDSQSLPFTIKNYGQSPITLTGTPKVSVSGSHAADFEVSPPAQTTISPGGSAVFGITFHPTLTALENATISIATDASPEPFTFSVSGTGVAAKLTQTITFSPPASVFMAESPLSLTAFASSGLPVKLSVVSGGASISGGMLQFAAPGLIKIKAEQAGDALFKPAATVTRTIKVLANPATLALSGLSHIYDGTPKAITTLGASSVAVQYLVNGTSQTNPPSAAGNYPVTATAGTVVKKGTLVIAKAPLNVTPDPKRKFVGADNPPLTVSYSGFKGADSPANALSSLPTLTTTAKKTSLGGTYPIRASGGTSANYVLIHQPGTLVVESLAGSYEALLLASGSGNPAGKLFITVPPSGTSFTGKIQLVSESAPLGLFGQLSFNAGSEQATATASTSWNNVTFDLDITLPARGAFSAALRKAGSPHSSCLDGRKIVPKPIPFGGAYTVTIDPPASTDAPKGMGWATAQISAKGELRLNGKLGDGTPFTASLLPDGDFETGYRLLVQPYPKSRSDSFMAGTLRLLPQPGKVHLRHIPDGTVSWAKAAGATNMSYRDGFALVQTSLKLAPWVKPSTSQTLSALLGLQPAEMDVVHSQTGNPVDGTLPTRVSIGATNKLLMLQPAANLARWNGSINATNGTFTGGFSMTIGSTQRSVSFTGVMRQPTDGSDTVIGGGYFAIPPASGTELSTGQIRFQQSN